MPSHAAANTEIKQLYINGHFCYAYKFGIVTNGLENPDYTLNADDIPCCPHEETLPLKYEGTSKLKSGVTRYKFVRVQKSNGRRTLTPANTKGSVIEITHAPHLPVEEWDNTYKIRTAVERDINHIKGAEFDY